MEDMLFVVAPKTESRFSKRFLGRQMMGLIHPFPPLPERPGALLAFSPTALAFLRGFQDTRDPNGEPRGDSPFEGRRDATEERRREGVAALIMGIKRNMAVSALCVL